jgi:hypothetical protein
MSVLSRLVSANAKAQGFYMSARNTSPTRIARIAAFIAVFLLALAVTSAASAKSHHKKRSSVRTAKLSAYIVTPNDGSTLSGRIDWRASATSSTGVRSVKFYIDGTLKVTDTVSPYTYVKDSGAFDTKLLADGKHTLKITATAGNSSTQTDSHAVTVSNATPPPPPPPAPGPDTTPPTVPGNIAATAITQTSATITWSPSTDETAFASYDIYKNGAWIDWAPNSPYVMNGLACGTNYTANVVALDVADNAASGVPVSFKTAACAPTTDSTAPSVPANLVSSAITQTAATLSWSASTDSLGVARYDVYKSGVFLKSVTGISTSVALTCGAASSFTVKAVDDAGNASAASLAKSITGLACAGDTTPPTVPGNVAATAITQTSATITWSPSTDETAFASYDIYKNGAWIDWSQNSPFVMNGLTCGTSYTANVVALDVADNTASGTPVSFSTSACAGSADTTSPSAPSNLTSSSITQTGATLTWTASTDNVGIDHYELSKDGAFVKNVTGTSTSVSLTCGIASSFTVVAKDAAGNAAASAARSITGAACSGPADTTKPSAPSALASSNISQNGATLSWTASTDNVGIDHYTVYKDAVSVGQTSSASYNVTLNCGVKSTFSVAAFDVAGNSATSTGLDVTGAACSTGGINPPAVPGTWTLNFSDEFNGSSLDATKWCSSWFNGGSMNNVSTSPSNVSVAGGSLVLNQSSSSTGSLVNSNPSDCGHGYTMTTGFYAEASVYFPGNGTSMNNWPAWWTNGQSWPANGEIDIAEGLGSMSSNYHSPSGANNFMVSGTWTNAYHTYAVDREAGVNKIYFDGQLVRTYNTDDGGAPEYLIFNQGGSGSTGAASQVKVDWVRVWKK